MLGFIFFFIMFFRIVNPSILFYQSSICIIIILYRCTCNFDSCNFELFIVIIFCNISQLICKCGNSSRLIIGCSTFSSPCQLLSYETFLFIIIYPSYLPPDNVVKSTMNGRQISVGHLQRHN